MKLIQSAKDPGYLEFFEFVSTANLLGYDVETTGLDFNNDKILLIQIGDDKEQYVFDTRKLKKDMIPILEALVERPSLKLVAHNSKFDYGMTLTNYNIRLDNIACTFINAKLLNIGKMNVGSGLAESLEKFCGVTVDKKEQKSFINMKDREFTKSQLEYAALDIVHLIKLYQVTITMLRERNMLKLAELEHETAKVTAEMEIYGVYVDKKLWMSLKDDAEQIMVSQKKKLDDILLNAGIVDKDLFGCAVIDYNSPQQLKAVLTKLLGFQLESTSKDYLKTIDEPVITELMEYRKAMKLYTTYGENWYNDHYNETTGRIHPSYNQLGPDSGRWSSEGPNIQQIPKKQIYRDPFCVKDPENYRIISADYSGQELRLLAQISKEPMFIKALEDKKDLHAYCASLLYGITYESFFEYENGEIKRDKNGEPVFIKEMKKKYRDPAKSLSFGLIYGMGPGKLSRELGITLDEAKQLFNKYFKTFPKIKELMDKLTKDVKINKYAYSELDGRRRDLTSLDWDNPRKAAHGINQAKNLPFQGAGATITKKAVCLIRQAIIQNNYDAKIICTVHDEILVECHKNCSDAMSVLVYNLMKEAFNIYACDVPAEVSLEVGTKWIH